MLINHSYSIHNEPEEAKQIRKNFVELRLDQIAELPIGDMARYFRERLLVRHNIYISPDKTGDEVGLSFRTKLGDLENNSASEKYGSEIYKELLTPQKNNERSGYPTFNIYRLSHDEKFVASSKIRGLYDIHEMVEEAIEYERDRRPEVKNINITPYEKIDKSLLKHYNRIVLDKSSISNVDKELEAKPMSYDHITIEDLSPEEKDYMENSSIGRKVTWAQTVAKIASFDKSDDKTPGK